MMQSRPGFTPKESSLEARSNRSPKGGKTSPTMTKTLISPHITMPGRSVKQLTVDGIPKDNLQPASPAESRETVVNFDA